MVQRTFTCSPSKAIEKIKELREDGWKIIATANTSTPTTEPDAHGVSYGGPSFEILAERETDYKKVDPNFPFGLSKPMSPRCR